MPDSQLRYLPLQGRCEVDYTFKLLRTVFAITLFLRCALIVLLRPRLFAPPPPISFLSPHLKISISPIPFSFPGSLLFIWFWPSYSHPLSVACIALVCVRGYRSCLPLRIGLDNLNHPKPLARGIPEPYSQHLDLNHSTLDDEIAR